MLLAHRRRAVPRRAGRTGRSPRAPPRSRALSEMADVLAAAIATGRRCPTAAAAARGRPRHARPWRPSTLWPRARDRARRTGRPHNAGPAGLRRRRSRRAGRPGRYGASAPTRTPTTRSAGTTHRATTHAAGRGRPRRDPPRAARGSPRCARPSTSCGRSLTPAAAARRPVRRPTDRLATAAPRADRGGAARCCSRPPDGGWTPADVPLLDEAAELLGARRPGSDVAGQRDSHRRRLEYAAGRAGHRRRLPRRLDDEHATSGDPRRHRPARRRSARRAARVRERLTTAERAAADRSWAFGHVIVDEAQELSPMAWRLLHAPLPEPVDDGGRRRRADRRAVRHRAPGAKCSSRTSADRWRLHRADASATGRRPRSWRWRRACSHADRPRPEPPRSVRDTGERALAPRVATRRSSPRRWPRSVGRSRRGRRRPARRDRAGGARWPSWPRGRRRDPRGGASATSRTWRAPVVVLTVRQAKGLEFDTVLVVDPDRIVRRVRARPQRPVRRADPRDPTPRRAERGVLSGAC